MMVVLGGVTEEQTGDSYSGKKGNEGSTGINISSFLQCNQPTANLTGFLQLTAHPCHKYPHISQIRQGQPNFQNCVILYIKPQTPPNLLLNPVFIKITLLNFL